MKLTATMVKKLGMTPEAVASIIGGEDTILAHAKQSVLDDLERFEMTEDHIDLENAQLEKQPPREGIDAIYYHLTFRCSQALYEKATTFWRTRRSEVKSTKQVKL